MTEKVTDKSHGFTLQSRSRHTEKSIDRSDPHCRLRSGISNLYYGEALQLCQRIPLVEACARVLKLDFHQWQWK